MVEATIVEIEDFQVTISAIPLMKGLLLEKKLAGLLACILGGLKTSPAEAGDSDVDLDFEAVARGFQNALDKMSDSEYETMVSSILRYASVVIEGKGVVGFDSPAAQTIFAGNSILIYKVMYHVMRVNKFAPFALMQHGDQIREIASSVLPKREAVASGKNSGASAPSPRKRKSPFQLGA